MNILLRTFRYFTIILVVTEALAQVPEPLPSFSTPRAERVAYSHQTFSPSPSPEGTDGAKLLLVPTMRQTTFPSAISETGTLFFVTTTLDTGAGSLRRAIEDANASAGADEIRFQIPGGGPHIIQPKTLLPEITDPVTIDGSTALGYFGRPLIHLDGSLAGISHGLEVSAPACTLKALSITRFSFSGVSITAPSTHIEACYIGVDPDGVSAGGNTLDGVTAISANNSFGRPGGLPNVISGNGRSGIMITGAGATGNKVTNSYIGTNWTADGAIPNGRWGIHLLNAANAVIGGTATGARNILSGNANAGIGIVGSSAQNIVVQGNYIGTGADTRVAIPNQNHGIEVAFAQGLQGSPSNILIGGKAVLSEKNVISGNKGAGVAFFLDGLGGTGNVVAGNLIGSDAVAPDTVPNTFGIYLERKDTTAAMPGVRIGGVRADSANVITGNRAYGIWLNESGARNNQILGNYIGANPYPSTSRPNGEAGIFLTDATRNTIGGADTLSGNIISGNLRGGIVVLGSGYENQIVNNYIGTNEVRSSTIGNGLHGIYLEASRTTVGKVNAGNIIARNALSGIFVFSGTRNTFRKNSIFRNGTMGIDLSPTGLTPNDTSDADSGPNDLLNFPIIDSIRVTATTTRIAITLKGIPGKNYIIDFYGNDTLSASLFGEGQHPLGRLDVTPGSDSSVSMVAILSYAVDKNLHITATATDEQGNTSEFCRGFCIKDTDGDAIADCWETQGIGMDINMDGLVDLDLYLRGGSPRHKDIFVEVDRMTGFQFDTQARDMARAFFAAAPNAQVNNPDNQDGINLVIKYDPSDSTIPVAAWAENPWPEFHAAKRVYFGSDLERAHPNGKMIIEAKRRMFRYCIFAERYDTLGSSGMAEDIIDNDFFVSLGNWNPVGGTVEEQAGTFIHELGHTLGLYHGGSDTTNWKPNYLSIMNYAWQFPRQDLVKNKLTWKPLFSPAQLDDLNELNLNEEKGLNVPPGTYPAAIFPFRSSNNTLRTGLILPGAAVDWNADGDSSATGGIAANVNAIIRGHSPSGETLHGHADWPALVYDMQRSPTYNDPPSGIASSYSPRALNNEPEMTYSMYEAINALPPFGLIPGYGAPSILPSDPSTVGGNRGTLILDLGEPAPSGGVTYYLRSTAPDILGVPPTVFVYQGSSEGWFEYTTRGVEKDTSIRVFIDSLRIPLSTFVRVRPASLEGLNVMPDSGCTVGGPASLPKTFIAGANILFEAPLDGESPPTDMQLALTSSRPDLAFAPAGVTVSAQTKKVIFTIPTSADISSTEEVIITAQYRGISKSDTVRLFAPPITYTFTDITPPAGFYVYKMKINNANQVLMIKGDYTGYLWSNGSIVRADSMAGFSAFSDAALNDSGWIGGSDSLGRPAIWKSGLTELLPSVDTVVVTGTVTAINNQGDAVGSFGGTVDQYSPVLWHNGSVQVLGSLPPYFLTPRDINESGLVIIDGFYYNSLTDQSQAAFLWHDGVFTRIYNPYGFEYYWTMYGRAINNTGTVLLSTRIDYGRGDNIMFTWSDGVTTTLPAAEPYNLINPMGINNNGDIVGGLQRRVEDEQTWYSAFLLKDGLLYDLKCLAAFPSGWIVQKAFSINDAGVIVGWATFNDEDRVFLLSPASPVVSDIQSSARALPAVYSLEQNYPNPFNPSTRIRYSLPAVARVRLTVYDLLGREVASLVDEVQSAGYKEVTWNATGFASGVYFYRIEAMNPQSGEILLVDVRRMVIVK